MTQNTISELKKEVSLLRSFVIGIAGRDKEGEYRPQFVKKILKATHEQTLFSFKNQKTFLDHLKAFR